MRFVLVFIITLLVSGCAELSQFKIAEDGRFYFKENSVSVWAPKECVGDIFVYESETSVDFVLGRGYWQAYGVYALQVYPIPDSIVDEATYFEETKQYFETYMVKDRATAGVELTVESRKEIKLAGKPAYQAISVDKGKAVFIATSQFHENYITVASLLYPWKEGMTFAEMIPAQCYEKFTESVKT